MMPRNNLICLRCRPFVWNIWWRSQLTIQRGKTNWLCSHEIFLAYLHCICVWIVLYFYCICIWIVLCFHGETNLLRTSHASAVQFLWCHVTMWSVCNARGQSQCNVITVSTYVIYPQYLSTIGISGKHSRLWNTQNVELLLVSCSEEYSLFTQSSKNLKNSPQSPFSKFIQIKYSHSFPQTYQLVLHQIYVACGDVVTRWWESESITIMPAIAAVIPPWLKNPPRRSRGKSPTCRLGLGFWISVFLFCISICVCNCWNLRLYFYSYCEYNNPRGT